MLMAEHAWFGTIRIISPTFKGLSFGDSIIPCSSDRRESTRPGIVFLLASLATCPVGAGWTFTTPYSLIDAGAFTLLALGMMFMALSWVATGINFIVTVHQKRTDGMGFFDMPILSWSLYLTSYVLLACGLLFDRDQRPKLGWKLFALGVAYSYCYSNPHFILVPVVARVAVSYGRERRHLRTSRRADDVGASDGTGNCPFCTAALYRARNLIRYRMGWLSLLRSH